MREILKEQVNINGAEFLGNAYGFDVYKITTWEAAKYFKVFNQDENTLACDVWLSSRHSTATPEQNFHSYVETGRNTVFYIALENTDKVLLAALGGTRNASFSFGFAPDKEIKNLNYLIHDSSGRTRCYESTIPLFLIPDLTYLGDKGVIYSENKIIGTYKGLLDPNNIPEQYVVPNNIRVIASNSFSNYPVPYVLVDINVTMMSPNAFKDYEGTIDLGFESFEDSGWPTSWTNIEDPRRLRWGYHLSAEEKAARAEAARIEAERVAAEKAAAEEAERRRIEFQTQPAENVLRYKEVGGNIVILGVKRDREKLDIPETINNKPVTEIVPFAFYNNKHLTEVRLPKSIKIIGKAAFYNCSNATIYYYPRKTEVRADAFEHVHRTRAQYI